MADMDTRRRRRLERYDQLREERPELFVNPPGANPEILFDRADQQRVADDCAKRYEQVGIPTDYADIGVVYEDPYVIVVRDAVRFDSGRENSYVRVLGQGDGVGAAVIPLTDDGRIVLVRHFRHDPRAWQWEVPRGFGEPGSDGAQTARRELTEELGVEAASVILLGATADADMYAAHLDRATTAALDARLTTVDADEGIEGHRIVTLRQFQDMLLAGEVTDPFTLVAFSFAVVRGVLRPRLAEGAGD